MKKKKIFRKEKYIEVMLDNIIKYMDYDIINELKFAICQDGWVPKCDGREVIDGFIGIFFISDEWCEVVEDE